MQDLNVRNICTYFEASSSTSQVFSKHPVFREALSVKFCSNKRYWWIKRHCNTKMGNFESIITINRIYGPIPYAYIVQYMGIDTISAINQHLAQYTVCWAPGYRQQVISTYSSYCCKKKRNWKKKYFPEFRFLRITLEHFQKLTKKIEIESMFSTILRRLIWKKCELLYKKKKKIVDTIWWFNIQQMFSVGILYGQLE